MFRPQQGIGLCVVSDFHRDRIEFKRLTYQGRDVAQQEQFHHRAGVVKIGQWRRSTLTALDPLLQMTLNMR